MSQDWNKLPKLIEKTQKDHLDIINGIFDDKLKMQKEKEKERNLSLVAKTKNKSKKS
jgi:hypothetical protein